MSNNMLERGLLVGITSLVTIGLAYVRNMIKRVDDLSIQESKNIREQIKNIEKNIEKDIDRIEKSIEKLEQKLEKREERRKGDDKC